MADGQVRAESATGSGRGEARWPMALAVVATGLLRAALPPELRNGDARWLFLVLVAILLGVLIIGDPGRIDRDREWLRVMTSVLIGVITVANADAAIRLVASIIDVSSFTNNAKVLLASGGAIWLTNVIAFGLWYWALDRGGPAARAGGIAHPPALVFPKFVDYFHFAFATATAFSPTDVSAIRPWMKLMMMAEEAISLIVALLVVARAVNILK
jgi:hypothetical protein